MPPDLAMLLAFLIETVDWLDNIDSHLLTNLPPPPPIHTHDEDVSRPW